MAKRKTSYSSFILTDGNLNLINGYAVPSAVSIGERGIESVLTGFIDLNLPEYNVAECMAVKLGAIIAEEICSKKRSKKNKGSWTLLQNDNQTIVDILNGKKIDGRDRLSVELRKQLGYPMSVIKKYNLHVKRDLVHDYEIPHALSKEIEILIKNKAIEYRQTIPISVY